MICTHVSSRWRLVEKTDGIRRASISSFVIGIVNVIVAHIFRRSSRQICFLMFVFYSLIFFIFFQLYERNRQHPHELSYMRSLNRKA